MTDEQVQRIVDALSNPLEPGTSLGVASISLAGGYLIAVLSHLTTERRRLRLDKVTARKSAVSRAQLVILHLVTCPQPSSREE